MSESKPEGAQWAAPLPEQLPRPSSWPLVLAAGIVILAYGLIFSLWFAALGIALIVAGIGGWIGDLRHDRD